MNYPQLIQVMAVTAAVVLPLGIFFGSVARALARWVNRRLLRPRYLKVVAIRRGTTAAESNHGSR